LSKIVSDTAAEAFFATVLARSRRIFEQQRTDQERTNKGKRYALHAPEVACIGKGKARIRYAFGVKTAIATINSKAKDGQFVVGAQSLPGNPYDGHTLGTYLAHIWQPDRPD
jgi:IS5 family transposase